MEICEINSLTNITTEQVNALQQKNLEILEYFKTICIENNLRFYFCGGCLIGTMRHKGFIPWDDDIDLFMPREDYEKLGEIWNTASINKNYIYCRTNQLKNYHHSGTSIKDVNTTFINSHSVNEDIEHAVGIEIVPIDGCAPTKFSRYMQLAYAMTFALFNTQRLPDNKGKFVRNMAKIAYFLVPSKNMRYQLWRYCEKKMSQYSYDGVDEVTELIGSLKGMLIKHPKLDFESSVWLPFENTQMPVMKGYHRYLTLIFDDYMKLPDKSERFAKHDTVYINLCNSYKNYKGIYYLKETK